MKTLLACIDLSPISEDVIRTASQLATGLSATLHLLHVVEGDVLIRQYDPVAGFTESVGHGPDAAPTQNLAAERRRLARQSVDLLAGRLRSEGANVVTHLSEGEHMTSILDEMEAIRPDLIIVGSHGRGLAYHLVAGSTTQGLLKKARCPVVVVPAVAHRQEGAR